MKNEEIPLTEGTRILAIDYGQKFTGLACYNYKIDPFPLTFGRIKYSSDKQLTSEIQGLVASESFEIVLVGIPKLLDGKETKMTKTVKSFFVRLEKTLNCSCLMIDETLSTYEAKKRMESSPQYNFQIDLTRVDEVAAQIILEDFINSYQK